MAYPSELIRAANIRAPHGNGSGHAQAVVTQGVTTAASTAVDTGVVATGSVPGSLYSFFCDQDCFIRFSSTSTVTAVTTDWPITANVPQVFVLLPDHDRYFSVIRSTTNGTLRWYRSSD